MAPAATPIMANGDESWNQPVMATSVVYMQKEDGRNAEEREQKKRIIRQDRLSETRHILIILLLQSFIYLTFIGMKE